MAENIRAPWPCRDYNRNGCPRHDCTHSHICKKFVDPDSFCNEGKQCKFNHNLFDPQVKHCLVKSGFDINIKSGKLRKAYSDALQVRKRSLGQRKNGQNPSPLLYSAPVQTKGIIDEIERLTALLNVPRVCLNYNQRLCFNHNCDLIHICHAYVHSSCKKSFSECSISHDISQPRIKDILGLAGFNVNQAPINLMEDYRQALRVPSAPFQGSQGKPLQERSRRPAHSSKLDRSMENTDTSKSCLDLRSEVVKKAVVKKRSTSGSRKVLSRSSSCSDSGSNSIPELSSGENSEEEMTRSSTDLTQKKGKKRRGGKKKQKPKARNDQLGRSMEHVDQQKSAIAKPKGNSGDQPGACKPSVWHVSILDDATICVDFLKGHCRHQHCLDHHQDMPYLWQHKVLQNGWKWKTFNKDNCQLLEQSFCNVSTTSCPFILEGQMFSVDFDNMAASSPELNFPVRRLTSASYVDDTDPPSFLTQWRWYWESDEGWTTCGQQGKDARCSEDNPVQRKLEKAYQEDPSSGITFKMKDFKRKVDFPLMMQTNTESGTQQRLRRRPLYFSSEDKAKALSDEIKKGDGVKKSVEESFAPGNQIQVSLPSSWRRMSKSDPEVILVDVPKDSMDYGDISLRFQLTLPKASILLIKRIQNPTLWAAMQLKKSKMERANGEGEKRGDIREMNLFHGTKPGAVNPICEQNFDWRLYGSASGTRYGKGVYFALQAEKADQYVEADENDLCFMFSARVLLGKYTKGSKTLKRPPPVDPANPNKLFDSCTDDPNLPNLFVLFDKDQFYPEFVICYQK